MTFTLGFTPAMNDAGVHALHDAYHRQLGPIETIQAVFKAMYEGLPAKAESVGDVAPMTGPTGNWRTQRDQ